MGAKCGPLSTEKRSPTQLLQNKYSGEEFNGTEVRCKTTYNVRSSELGG
jgi:hypothetical protein